MLEARGLLVDGIVGQVHAELIQVGAIWSLILLCGKPCQALLVNIASKGRDACNQNIKPQIKLESIDQKWPMHILLGHVVLTLLYPFIIPRQENSIPLTVILRFDNKSFGPLAIKLIFKTFRICREHPSLWKEIELIRHSFLHHIEVPRE